MTRTEEAPDSVSDREDVVLEAAGVVRAPSQQPGEARETVAVSLPHARAEESARARRPVGAERKQVTVMFADLSGFTAMAETTDAEDVRNIVNAVFERIGAVVTRYDGYIDKFIGDELMALFGAPAAMEDHASRALHAALDMRDALEAFKREPGESRAALSMHFGINSGLVVAGVMGTQDKSEYTVIGDAVNVAARLVSHAQPGEILVGARTRQLVGPGFDFADAESIKVDGRAQPVEAYRLIGGGVRAQATREVLARDTPMFGRRWEFDTLQEIFGEVVSQARPRSIAVIGPAGIGKSRLRREFVEWLHVAHPLTAVLHGSALPHMAATPYFIFIDLIKNWLGVSEADTADQVRQRLTSALADVDLDDPDLAHAVAAMMGIPYERDRLAGLGPEQRRDRTFEAAAALLGRITSSAPAVLIFEDLHWVDDLTLDLLDHLFGALKNSPVAFLTFTRPITDAQAKVLQVESRLPRDAHTRIVLQELDQETAGAFVAALVPGIERSPELVRTIINKAQGNPFFVEAIVGMLSDQGILAPGEHGVSLAHDPNDVTVPDTVWGVLAERIDRLRPDERRTLQTAAIVGRLFWEGLVRELAQLSAGPLLNTLSQMDFVDRIGPAAFADDWEWSFRHILVQEVAYNGLLRNTRRAAHNAAAEWLEGRVADRRGEYATLLAHHFQLGEGWPKAADYAELAADAAADLFAHREAGHWYLQTLSALSNLKDTLELQERRIDVTLKLTRVALHRQTHDVLPALETAKRLATEIGDDGRRVKVLAAIASWLYISGQARPAVETALQSIATGTEAGREDLLLAPYTILGRAMLLMGEYGKCAEMIERSRGLAERYAIEIDAWSALGLGPSLGFLGIAYQQLGEWEKGRALGLEALRIAEQRRDLRQIGIAHQYLGATACHLGRLEEAQVHLPRAASILEETGDLAVLHVTLGFLGHCHGQQGRLDLAAEHLNRALALAAETDSYVFVPFLRAFRAEVEIKMGRPAAAETMAERAIELGRETRQQAGEAEAHRVLAWAMFRRAGSARIRAEEELRQALELDRKIGARVMEARVLFELADLLDEVGDASSASASRAEAAAISGTLALHWLPLPPPTPPRSAAPGSMA